MRGNIAKSEMVEFEKEMKGEGLDEGQISQCRDIVRGVYIGQNIRQEGVLQSDFDNFDTTPIITSLLKCNYIKRDRFHSHHLYCTTEKGSKIGKIVVTNIINKNKGLENFLAEQPQKVLNFVIQEHLLKDGRPHLYIYPVDANDISVFNGKDSLRKNNEIHTEWTSVLSKLKTLGLCIRTHNYFSTNADPREEYYVISPEILEFLVKHCPKEEVFTTEEYDKIRVYDVLSYFRRSSDYSSGAFKDALRNRLIDAELEEEKVKKVIEEMAGDGITSEYKGFQSSEAPFSIKDQYRYEDWLEKNLLEPVVQSLLGASGKGGNGSVGESDGTGDVFSNDEKEPIDVSVHVFEKGRHIPITDLQKELIKCFNEQPEADSTSKDYLMELEKKFKDIIDEFDINCEVDYHNFEVGPRLIRADLKPNKGMRYETITRLSKDIANRLFKEKELFPFDTEADIPKDIEIENVASKGMFGIYIPRKGFNPIGIRNILLDFPPENTLNFSIGKNIIGENVYSDLEQMPHLLVSGATNSGKSVFINSMLVGLLFQNEPSNLNLILIDPKGGLELASYEDIKHLYKNHIYVELEESIQVLIDINQKMEERYKLFKEKKVKKLSVYNQKYPETKLQYFVIVIDEFANLVQKEGGKELSALIQKIAEKGRAAGIHLVISTQRPSVQVISGNIKANIPGRLSFRLPSDQDSRVILDEIGAEKLFGRGDLLLIDPERALKVRCQGTYVDDDEIEKFIHKIKDFYN